MRTPKPVGPEPARRPSRYPYFVAWGKLQRDVDGHVTAVHSLLDHMIDVAACLEAVVACGAVRRALDAAAAPHILDDVDFARLSVLAFLHDIGKANAGFQAKFWASSHLAPRFWPLPSGHGPEGWALLSGGVEAPDVLRGLPIEEIASWGPAVCDLLHASLSHHGRPVSESAGGFEHLWRPVRDSEGVIYDPAATVAEIGSALTRLFPKAFTADNRTLPDSPAFVHLFAGLVQLADWLGSDTREAFFPYSQPGEDRSQTAPERATHAVRIIGLDARVSRLFLQRRSKTFVQVFGVPSARPMQAAMGDDDLGPVVVLEAETGSGKTEAALWRFLHLFRSGKVDSLYFALPTRVAASQLYERVVRFAERVWPDEAPVVVRALPGYEAADRETVMRLPAFRVLWSDEPGDRDAERRWVAESPKRFLAATVAVGTIDQALLGVLKVRHAHLRHSMLARSLFVVDEVHASDAYMTTLLQQLLQAHVACGGHALLLSATLGSVARTRYLSVGHTRLPPPTLTAAAKVAYPAIGTRSRGELRLMPVVGDPRTKVVHWQTVDAMDDTRRVAAIAVEAAERGARVLVIRNTVPAAIATLQAVEASDAAGHRDFLFKVNGVSTLHHSRFSRQDRPLLDREIERQIGKHRDGVRGVVVIGTQTLEQSLDIDADVLITDLCPMDVLLQRIGRLHRHARPSADAPADHRPAGFETARAWVLTPHAGDLTPMLKRARHGLGPLRTREGLQGVYIDLRTLEATRRLIDARPFRSIPAENRMLVEHATHGEALDAIAEELGADWQRFGQDVEGSIGAKASLGRLHALPYDEPYGGLSFSDDERRIATRLGAADRLIEFEPPMPGPFGQLVRQLPLRHHQAPRNLDADVQPTHLTQSVGADGFTFRLGDAVFRYDRLGLQRLQDDESVSTGAGAVDDERGDG